MPSRQGSPHQHRGHAVASELVVCGGDGKPEVERLGHEEPVERFPVEQRQYRDREGVGVLNRHRLDPKRTRRLGTKHRGSRATRACQTEP